MPPPDTTAQVAITAAQVASDVTIHSYINHALLLLVSVLLGIIGWFGRGTLIRIESKICGKADGKQNDLEHGAIKDEQRILWTHYHVVNCEQPDCTRKTGDAVVPHGHDG